VKTSQQLKLSNFVKRKGDNNNAVTDVSKQSKSSSINDVEIVHAIPVSKACNLKSETKSVRCSGKKLSRQLQDSWLSDFAWLVYENGLMTYKFCKTFPGMAREFDFSKDCKTFKKETLIIHSESQKHKGIVVKGLTWRNMTQQKISKLGFPERGKY
jgi:hypothetical protein